MSDATLTKRQVRTLRVLLRQHGIEEGLTEAIKLWMAIHWVVVPWCAEHDHEWINGRIGCGTHSEFACRLEQPASHYKIGGNDE